MALTFEEAQGQVNDITHSRFYDDMGRIKRIINEVYFDVVQQVLTPIKTTAAIALTNGVADYALSSAPFSLTDFIQARDVIYNQTGAGPNRTLRQFTPHEIYASRNQIFSGYLYGFAIEGVDGLRLAPSPSTGDTLTLVYNYRPQPLAVLSDTFTLLPDEDADAVIVGAAARVARWKDPQLWMQLLPEYQRLIGVATARQNRKGGSADRRMRLRDIKRPPHDNSTDTGS